MGQIGYSRTRAANRRRDPDFGLAHGDAAGNLRPAGKWAGHRKPGVQQGLIERRVGETHPVENDREIGGKPAGKPDRAVDADAAAAPEPAVEIDDRTPAGKIDGARDIL